MRTSFWFPFRGICSMILFIWILLITLMVQTNAFVIWSSKSKLPITMPFYTSFRVVTHNKHSFTFSRTRYNVYDCYRSRNDSGDIDGKDGTCMHSWKKSRLLRSIMGRTSTRTRTSSNAIATTLLTILFSTCISMTWIPSSVANASSNNYIMNENKATMPPSSIETKNKPNNAYWNTIANPNSSKSDIRTMNEKLFDQVVGNINTLYYDNSGGSEFYPKDFYDRWKVLKAYAYHGMEGLIDLGMDGSASRINKAKSVENGSVRRGDAYIPQLFWIDHDSYSYRPMIKMQKGHLKSQSASTPIWTLPQGEDDSSLLDSRESTVKGIKWLVSTLEDPYSKYLTREELEKELLVRDDGFLGLGAIVEIPPPFSASPIKNTPKRQTTGNLLSSFSSSSSRPHILSLTAVKNLPQITAIAPDSPAERAGLVVGDRVVAVGTDKFLGLARDQVIRRLSIYTGADNYFGYPELTIAKPVILVNRNVNINTSGQNQESQSYSSDKEELVGYKLIKARLRTASLDQLKPYQSSRLVAHSSSLSSDSNYETILGSDDVVRGGDSIVHWQMITSKASIFTKHYTVTDQQNNPLLISSSATSSTRSSADTSIENVGYIRLTRFSRSSTAGFVKAVDELERNGAQAYIIDLRNNYGGVIQEAMLTAASLLRDPHAVLCYTINSRGGFTPHDVEEYIIDKRYPGYLLSSESKNAAINQAKRDDPDFFSDDGWTPPSAFASLHEQRQNRHIVPSSMIRDRMTLSGFGTEDQRQWKAQKKIVILQNEGTASAAEVFVSSLKDNGRLVGTVGSKTYGKGLIQHTLPLPDGGGLRLTVAEYLTPSLQHVTKVGGAQYDRITGKYVGGGLLPDVQCDSRGIPSNVGADLCVGVALDMLEDATASVENNGVKSEGGVVNII